ncbi:phage portal protein [Psychrobacillus sp. NPDC096389]|uniref:phage tail assembly chaperone n=1 Tax=Psychrobacillus sp. NPDC096389 TaxID=3364490 RepID=UPI00380B6E26
MSNLTAFLAQNALKAEVEKHVVSKRFVEPVIDEETGKQMVDKNGKPMTKPVEWEVGSIDSAEDEALRKLHTKRLPVPGKKNVFQPTTDISSYMASLAVKCTVFPNLHDAELQKSYGVMGAEALLKTMLLSGEYAEYINIVQKVNLFDVEMEETVEEAKN